MKNFRCLEHSKRNRIWSELFAICSSISRFFAAKCVSKTEIFSHNSFESVALAMDSSFKGIDWQDVMFSLVSTAILRGCIQNFFPPFTLMIINGHSPLILFLLVVSKWSAVANSSSYAYKIANTAFLPCWIAKKCFVLAMILAYGKTLLYLSL